MAKVSTNLGKVATTPKGVYSNETTYVKLDIVTYNGSSYVCLKESVGILPTNTQYWQLIASKGDNGSKGNDGHTPVKGVDYFTQEDIESLNIPSELSELSEDTTHRVVTDVEKETWNNKSDFSGSYNDLTDKPNIPSKTSDLTNDSGFITSSVNNLVNYYLKNEVYTKDEVTQLIGAIQQFHYEVVQELPQTGANNIMYLVPKSTSQTNNVYDEYVYSNGWEKIGDTEIDLSNYVTITMLNQALANYTTTANLTTLLNAKQNEITITNKLDADLVDDSLSTNKFVTSAEKTTWNGKQDTLTAGDNITINNNVISASGGSKVLIYRYDGTTTQKNARAKEIAEDYINGINDIILIRNGSNYDCLAYAYTNDSVTSTVMVFYIIGFKISKGGNINYGITYGKIQQYLISFTYNPSNQIANVSTQSLTNSGFIMNDTISILGTSNTTAWTPTGDYNPATKKYVDDSIFSAVGSINTVLASLTTPSNNGGGE